MNALPNLLQRTFMETRAKNPSFSKRAFARKLGLSPGALVEIMSGARAVSPKMMARLADRLGVSAESITPHRPRAKRARQKNQVARKVISLEQFQALADLKHLHVLKALELPNVPKSQAALAKLLGLPEAQLEKILGRLLVLGFVAPKEGGGWHRAVPAIDTPEHVSSPAIRSAHRHALTLAEEALELPIDAREFSISLELGSAASLPRLRQLVRDFQDQVHRELASGPAEQIFQLNVQLFPIVKEERK